MYTACPISDAGVNTSRPPLVIEDFGVNTSRPSLVIEDLSSEGVTFSTGLPNKETFYLLFEHIVSNRNIFDSEIGGRPRNLRDVNEFFIFLKRLSWTVNTGFGWSF